MKSTLQRVLKQVSIALPLFAILLSPFAWSQEPQAARFAHISTNFGPITAELYETQTPITVNNFVSYAESGFYNNTIFHRVIPGFMIQGGGFDAKLQRKPVNAPIKNESTPKLKNLVGTLSMARTSNPHSATSQFFINVADNSFLDRSMTNPGYAVFGKVTSGMKTVYSIADQATGTSEGMQNVPKTPIIIESIEISSSPDASKEKETTTE